jgi:hypothetical protein
MEWRCSGHLLLSLVNQSFEIAAGPAGTGVVGLSLLLADQ